MIAQFDSAQCFDTGDGILLTWIEGTCRDRVAPEFVLRRLATSSSPDLRIALADRLSTSEDLLMLLSDDESDDVRFAIAENHNVSHKVLSKLLDDVNPYVAHRAETTLERLRIESIADSNL